MELIDFRAKKAQITSFITALWTLRFECFQKAKYYHHLIAKKLNFTQGYTKSSESLYDILSSDFRGDSIIKFKHLSILKAKLGTDYIENFVQAIENASVDNNRIVLLLE